MVSEQTYFILIYLVLSYCRFGEVSEVVNAVVFLLSERASMINGVELPIDGGFLAT